MVEGFPAYVRVQGGSNADALIGRADSKEKTNMTDYMTDGTPVNAYQWPTGGYHYDKGRHLAYRNRARRPFLLKTDMLLS